MSEQNEQAPVIDSRAKESARSKTHVYRLSLVTTPYKGCHECGMTSDHTRSILVRVRIPLDRANHAKLRHRSGSWNDSTQQPISK